MSTFWRRTQAGVIGIADPEVLRVAAAAGRIVVSHDRKTMPAHFARFLESQSSPGIVIVSQDLDISSAIEDLLLIWSATGDDDWFNRIGFLPV